MAILFDLKDLSPPPTPNPLYRSRLRAKALALLEQRKRGANLNNQQKRLVRRWQQTEAAKRQQLTGGTAA